MRVASGPFSHFELMDEYEAPLLNLQFDDFKAVFSHKKKATGASTTPQIPQKEP
jgi:alanine racemase